MKIILFAIVLISLTINLHADKNWIQIEPINKAQTAKAKTKYDVNLSQIEPINKMMKNASIVKKIIDATTKKEATTNDKNWFVLNTEESK